MLKFVLIASLLVSVALAAPLTDKELEEKEQLEKEQNASAQYEFSSSVKDKINDGMIEREEQREGTKVKGSYAYSDGYVMRKVYYEADENGYRVVKEETQEIGNGPEFNSEGQADVEGSLIGRYSIKLDKSPEMHYKDAQLAY